MRNKLFSLFILFFLTAGGLHAQLKNFGSGAKFKPQPVFLFGAYGYGDLVREYGVGFQYQFLATYNFDLSAYIIAPNPYFRDKIKQWDYYDLKGYGLSFKPKFQLSKLGRFYIGLNLAYEYLHHDKVWVEYYEGRGSQIHHNLETANGYAYTIGCTIGEKLSYKQLFFEPFFGIGITSSILNKTTHAYNRPLYYTQLLPYSFKDKRDFFQMNLGLKIGFSFKKNKKHAAIDKKFDEVYIPKAKSIERYLKTVDFEHQATSKYLQQAKTRLKLLNGSTLRRYRRNYGDTALFYQKVDVLFAKIDSLIVKAQTVK